MKKFIKNNIIVIVIICIFSLIFLNGDYYSLKEINNLQEQKNNIIEKCKTEDSTRSKEEAKICKESIKNQHIKVDFYTALTNTIVWKVQFVYYIAFLGVVIPALYQVTKLLKNKFIINANTRESYNKFLKKLLMKAYQYIWILPSVCLILFIPLLLNTSTNPEYSNLFSTAIWSAQTKSNIFIFIFSYLLYMVLVSVTFISIALLVARKQQKLIPSIIISYIVYLAIEMFFETVIRIYLYQRVLHSNFGIMYNILNIFTFKDTYGISSLLLLNLAFAIVSFILVCLVYRNKEKLVIQCEKNK